MAPDKLVLTSATGKPVSRFAIKVLAAAGGQVKVSPSGGSLPANGSVVVTVTVTSKVALTTHLTVEPGNLIVTVVFTV